MTKKGQPKLTQSNVDKKLSKHALRRLKKKNSRKLLKSKLDEKNNTKEEDNELNNITIEYIAVNDPEFESNPEFSSVRERFLKPEQLTSIPQTSNTPSISRLRDTEESSLTIKQAKRAGRLTISQLKQLVSNPEFVDAHDINSSDPKILIWLKSQAHTVPVPPHWCQKRRYLQGKRGIEKVAYTIPQYISDTGICEIRDAQLHLDSSKSVKGRVRERITPKLGRMDIDYNILHDSFYKYQTRPALTNLGDVYFEGKEFDANVREKMPGMLSSILRKVLGMKSDTYPPPYLLNMQRYGPPPSYPNLRIAGVNAPIPKGCNYGYGEGEWGKIPVDETGNPLYNEYFGLEEEVTEDFIDEVPIDKTRWGLIQQEIEDVEEILEKKAAEKEKEKKEDLEVEEEPQPQMIPETESGLTSTQIGLGLATPVGVELRKTGLDTPVSGNANAPPKDLYTVLEEKKAAVGPELFGSSHIYSIPNTMASEDSSKEEVKEDEEVMTKSSLKRKYEEELRREKEALRSGENFEESSKKAKL